jgi:hypothetical protein
VIPSGTAAAAAMIGLKEEEEETKAFLTFDE